MLDGTSIERKISLPFSPVAQTRLIDARPSLVVQNNSMVGFQL